MITDEMIVAAASELSLVMSVAFPDPAIDVHHFSFRFKRRMNRLINKTNHPTRYLWVQRVASFVLVLFMGFMLLFAASPSVRASVIGWIKEQWESYIEYFCPDIASAKEVDSDYFEITALPPGFVEIKRTDIDGLSMAVYSDNNGSFINFLCSNDPNAGNLIVRSEESTIVHEYVCNYEADIYIPDDPHNTTSIVWYDIDRNLLFLISTVDTAENIIYLAESIYLD